MLYNYSKKGGQGIPGPPEKRYEIYVSSSNRVVVYKDRVEIFNNLLPFSDTNTESQITDKDLATYGLIESAQKEKVTQTSDFPSENLFGDPFEVKGELFSSSRVTVLLCPL